MSLTESQNAFLYFANLMCSKVCHDIIGPLGAVQNGFELLEGESDKKAQHNILEIIQKSTHNAIAKMEFERLSMGLGGGTLGDDIHINVLADLCENYLKSDKTPFTVNSQRDSIKKNHLRVLMNLFLIAINSAPRCQHVGIEITFLQDKPQFVLQATSDYAKLDDNMIAVIQLQKNIFDLTPREVLYYYTGLLILQSEMKVTFNKKENIVEICAS